jgi:hypothetical protein
MTAQNWVILGVAIAVAVIVVIAVWKYTMKRRTEHLRSHFGPEYERAVSEFGDQRRAENELVKRGRRVQRLQIRPLTDAEKTRLSEQWRAIQGRFVDDPRTAVFEADGLVTEVLNIRGYPTADFEERIDNLSAAYPRVAASYREACTIVARHEKGGLTTEDLRRAMVLYRDLFNELFREDTYHEELRRAS